MHSLKNKTRTRPPVIPIQKLSRKVLGPRYELSVVFVGDSLMRSLNKTHRKKNSPTNVLSFPLAKDAGEIFLDLPYIAREAKKSGRPLRVHATYLFIHGLLHLKGLSHGSTMDREERKLLAAVRMRI